MHKLCLTALLLLPTSTLAQHNHPAPPPQNPSEAAHHAFLDAERAAIERGEGFGMALAADRNGYPGPKHVLELKEQLRLTPEQEAGMIRLMTEMKGKAMARGREILLAEERLVKMFSEGRPEPELREETFRIASLRAELRWVHLGTHVEARKILTAEQLAAYHRLRHGSENPHAH